MKASGEVCGYMQFECFQIDSAWIGEDQLWPYVEFREKYLIAQRAPLGFKEAVDAIEDVLRTRQGGSLSKVNIQHKTKLINLSINPSINICLSDN